MLQQTQVARVIAKYRSFLKAFPTPRALAAAPLAAVLREWSGLGYNRRAKFLREAAKLVVGECSGSFKKALKRPLPGVGPYTKAAVRTFAFNEPGVLIETNIRTAFIHNFFQTRAGGVPILDQEILPFAVAAAAGQDPRVWHWALMDYGTHLKKSGVRNNHRSAHYAKQSKFEGSLRQVRGAILRQLHQGPSTMSGFTKSRHLKDALEGLAKDGLIEKEKGRWRIA